MKMLLATAMAGALMGGCDRVAGDARATDKAHCFSVVSANERQPYAPILLDRCEGKSWLLVKTSLGAKPEDGFTYKWHALERFDYFPAVLVRERNP